MSQPYNLVANITIKNVVGLNAAVKQAQRAFNTLKLPNNLAAGVVSNLNAASNSTKLLAQGLSQTNAQVSNLVSQYRALAQVARQIGSIKVPVAGGGLMSPQQTASMRSSTAMIGKWTIAISTFYGVLRSSRSLVEFERELTKVQQVANLSQIAIRNLGETISTIAAKTGASRTGLAEGAGLLAQAGFNQRSIRSIIPTLADTSLGANFDSIKEVTNAIIAIRGAYPQAAKEGKDYARILNQISELSATYASESSDFTKGISRAGSAFKNAGGSLEEFLALQNTLRDRTRQSASVLANSIKSLSGRLVSPENVKLLRSLGVELSDANGKLKGPVRTIEELQQALKGLDQQERQSIITRIGGIFQANALATALDNVALTREGLATIENAGSRITTESIIKQRSFVGELDKTKASLENLIYQLANTSGIRRFTTDILQGVQALTKMTDVVGGMVPVLAGLGLAIAGPALLSRVKGHGLALSALGIAAAGGGLAAGGYTRSGGLLQGAGAGLSLALPLAAAGGAIGGAIGGVGGSLVVPGAGTVAGAAAGAKFGSIALPAAAVLAGGAYGYFAGGRSEQVRDTMRSTDDLTQRLLRSSDDNRLGAAATLARDISSNIGSLPTDQRRDYVYGLAKQEELLLEARQQMIEEAAKTGKINGDARDAVNNALQSINDVLGSYERQFNLETNQEISKIRKANEIRDRQNTAIQKVTSQIELQSRASTIRLNAIRDAGVSQSLRQTNAGAYANIFSRNLSNPTATSFADLVMRPESRFFRDSVGRLGLNAEQIGQATQVGTLAKSLPDILRAAGAKPLDERSGFISDQLTGAGISAEIAAKIERSLEGVDLGEKAAQTAERIVDELRESVLGPLAKIQREMEDQSNKTVGVFRQFNEQLQTIVGEQGFLAQMRGNAAAQALTAAYPFSDNAVGIAGIQAKVFADQQGLLANNGLDPSALDDQARALENEIGRRRKELTTTPAGHLFDERAKELLAFERQLINVNTALKNLATTSALSAKALAEIERLNQSAASRLSGRQSFLESDLQGRMEMVQQANFFGEAVRRGSFAFGDIQNPLMRIFAQQQAVKGAGLYGNALVPGTGKTGDELKRQLIDNTQGFPAFLQAQQSELDRRAQLQQELANINAIQIKAQEAYLNGLTRVAQMFLQGAELLGKGGVNPVQKAGGGMVGRGTDTIPAMLSAGEYVVRADSARKNRAALDQMNFGGAVYRAGGGPLNGSQQMAHDLAQWIKRKQSQYVDPHIRRAQDVAGQMSNGARLLGQDYQNSPGFGQALLGGVRATFGGGIPKFYEGPSPLDALAGGLNSFRPMDTLADQDRHNARMSNDPGYYYQQTGRIRIPSPYGKKREHTPAEQQYLDRYAKMFKETQRQAYRAQYRPDYGPQYYSGELDGFLLDISAGLKQKRNAAKVQGALSSVYGFQDKLNSIQARGVEAQDAARNEKDYRDMLAENRANRYRTRGTSGSALANFDGPGISDARFRRSRGKAYWRKVRIGAIDPSSMGYDEYVNGPQLPQTLSDRQSLVEGNIALRRQARRNRIGIPYYTDAERYRTGQNALSQGPLALPQWRTNAGHSNAGLFSVPDPVRHQEYSRQQSNADRSTYEAADQCCEIKAQLATSLNRFCETAPKLSDSLNRHADVVEKMPSEITMNGNHELHLAITGLNSQANVIGEALKPILIQIVRNEIGKGSVSSASPMTRMEGKG